MIAPNDEMKMTARSIRSTLARMVELSIENDWDALIDELEGMRLMAEKLKRDETTYVELAADRSRVVTGFRRIAKTNRPSAWEQ